MIISRKNLKLIQDKIRTIRILTIPTTRKERSLKTEIEVGAEIKSEASRIVRGKRIKGVKDREKTQGKKRRAIKIKIKIERTERKKEIVEIGRRTRKKKRRIEIGEAEIEIKIGFEKRVGTTTKVEISERRKTAEIGKSPNRRIKEGKRKIGRKRRIETEIKRRKEVGIEIKAEKRIDKRRDKRIEKRVARRIKSQPIKENKRDSAKNKEIGPRENKRTRAKFHQKSRLVMSQNQPI